MENASKALIMAGSILMAILVIGVLVFMFGRLSDVEQTKLEANRDAKEKSYEKKFEDYNKTLYGSEILSLANLNAHYTYLQDEVNGLNRGYDHVDIRVTMTNTVETGGHSYLTAGVEYTIEQIFNAIENENNNNSLKRHIVLDYETRGRGRSTAYDNSIKHYTQLSNRQISRELQNTLNMELIPYEHNDVGLKVLVDECGMYTDANQFIFKNGSNWEFRGNVPDNEIGMFYEALRNHNAGSSLGRLRQYIDEYLDAQSTYKQFKNNRYDCDSVDYTDVSTINRMHFTEIGP